MQIGGLEVSSEESRELAARPFCGPRGDSVPIRAKQRRVRLAAPLSPGHASEACQVHGEENDEPHVASGLYSGLQEGRRSRRVRSQCRGHQTGRTTVRPY